MTARRPSPLARQCRPIYQTGRSNPTTRMYWSMKPPWFGPLITGLWGRDALTTHKTWLHHSPPNWFLLGSPACRAVRNVYVIDHNVAVHFFRTFAPVSPLERKKTSSRPHAKFAIPRAPERAARPLSTQTPCYLSFRCCCFVVFRPRELNAWRRWEGIVVAGSCQHLCFFWSSCLFAWGGCPLLRVWA